MQDKYGNNSVMDGKPTIAMWVLLIIFLICVVASK